jgi:hypothetical protein
VVPTVHGQDRSARDLLAEERATANAIYGIIVSSAVMASAHGQSVVALAVAVLVTLVIYWGAERYARIVAERIHSGRRPDRHKLRHQLTTGWEMVTASFLPLAVLDVTRLVGAQLSTALLAGLSCSTLLLGIAGWEVGREGKLTTRERLVSATVAAAFGGVMIALKMLLH